MTADDFLRFARSIGEPALLVTPDGRILAANPPGAALLGIDPKPSGNSRLGDYVAGPTDELARYLAQCSRTRERVLGSVAIRAAGETRAYRAEGALLAPPSEGATGALLVRLVPREEATNRFVLLNQQIEALNHQVRRRLRSEEALRAERELLHITLESIGDAVIATDAAGRLTFQNPVASALTGWGEEEATDRPLEEVFRIVDENTREAVENPVARVLREGVAVGPDNYTVLVARDGTERPIEEGGAPIRGPDGRVVGVVLVFRDVSERRAAEREREGVLERERRARELAEEASRAKDEFLALVSHELRTPLNSMLGWMRLIRSGNTSEATLARGMQTIERNVLLQVRLIEDLLDVSSIVTGHLRLDVTTVELSTVVRAAVDSVRPAADAKSIRLEVALDSAPDPVWGDPDRLQQVVWNVLSNAIKFTPKGGEIHVRLARLDAHVEILVSDTGQGIEPEFLPYVFDRFRQADASITRRLGGLGLGLAIVKYIVEAHGGTVVAESTGPGRGASFAVRLPVMAPRQGGAWIRKAPAGPAGDALRLPAELDGVTVLLVDDEQDTREILALTLEAYRATVHAAASAAEALDLLADRRPDVLISDIGMPDQDGYTLISKVRALGPDRSGNVPAIALTAYAHAEDRRQALAAGFQMHVAKPVEPTELVLVIHALLGLGGRT